MPVYPLDDSYFVTCVGAPLVAEPHVQKSLDPIYPEMLNLGRLIPVSGLDKPDRYAEIPILGKRSPHPEVGKAAYISILTPGEIIRFPKMGNQRAFFHNYNDLGEREHAENSVSGTPCRGTCVQHGKGQQGVSCPPRFAPARLSLRSVRSSVERHALAGGGSPLPTPSHYRERSALPLPTRAQWSRRKDGVYPDQPRLLDQGDSR